MQPDWVRVGDETVALLQRLIQFDTRNPPGNELPLARFLVSTFESAGIPVQLFEPTPGRGQVVARLSGSGARRPVMLLAHMDVVGVEAEMWTCDPFAGVARDGFLYGRGAIDDKGMLAANVITMLQLKKHVDAGGSFSRDVVFVATADEEAGGECGMAWLVQHHPEVLDAEFALNEGGRTRIIPGGGKYLAVQTSEKISHVVELSVKGTAGHAAIPLPDNAIFALGRALALLADHREPVVLTPTTRSFFRDLARVWPDRDVARAMREVAGEDGRSVEEAAKRLSSAPVFNAVLRAGISPTVLSGGNRFNVIPAAAGVLLNVRTIPGQSIDDVVQRIRSAVGPGIEVRITESGEDAPVSDQESAMYRALETAAAELDPDMVVVPYLSTGVTDSARLRRLGINAYGILPFPMEQSDEERMHGHDERIPVDSLKFGTRLIYEAVRRVCTT